MKSFPHIAFGLLLVGCTSTFTDASKLPATINYRIENQAIILTAEVRNQSEVPVTFVDHPDFGGFSIVASDRAKDELINPIFLHFHRATKDDLVQVQPGKSAVFEERFVFRRKPGAVIELAKGEEFVDPLPYMRIWDSQLQAIFRYGKYPDYLPKHAWALGKNYVMADIVAKTRFARP